MQNSTEVAQSSSQPVAQQLTIKQIIEGQELDRKCNAAVLVYADGYVVLQKNVKDAPQWATVGGKVEMDDLTIIKNFAALDTDTLERKLVDLLRDQFKAEKDLTMATFAYAALREVSEEICGGDVQFIYEALLNKKATLVRVDRDSFGIPEANKKFWTEQFYLDFGKMPIADLMSKLQASGKKDCEAIVAAPIAQLVTKETEPGKFLTTYDGLMVRHTSVVVAKRIEALRQRIAAVKAIENVNDVLCMHFTENDPLKKADLGAGFSRVFLPAGQELKPENCFVLLGKRFNGQLKCSIGGAVDHTDASFMAAARRECDEELFGQLPITLFTNCITVDVNFKSKSGKPGTDGMLYYSFLGLEREYTIAEIDGSVNYINQVAPLYFSLNKFLTDLIKATPEVLSSDAVKQTAQEFLTKSAALPLCKFNAALVAELTNLVAGSSTLSGKALNDFTEDNVRVHSEYSYFQCVPYLQYKEALNNKTAISCTTPDGRVEDVQLFGAERDTVLAFMVKFEAHCAKMHSSATTTVHFDAVNAAALALAEMAGSLDRANEQTNTGVLPFEATDEQDSKRPRKCSR